MSAPIVPIDAVLVQFKPDDYTARLLTGVFKVVPYAPQLPFYRVVEDAVRAVQPDADPMAFAKTRQIAMTKDIQDILWMGRLLDTADKGYAAFTGLKSAWNLVRGEPNALENDDAQRNDAILKALGIAYMAYKVVPGGVGQVAQKAEVFRQLPAGQALTMYFAALEVALPFADNAILAGGNVMGTLIDKGAAAQAQRLAQLAGGQSMTEATTMLTAISGGVQRVVDHAVKYAKPVAEQASQYAPGVLAGADKVAGVAAEAADMMPVYTLLSTRLAVEAAAYRAIHHLG